MRKIRSLRWPRIEQAQQSFEALGRVWDVDDNVVFICIISPAIVHLQMICDDVGVPTKYASVNTECSLVCDDDDVAVLEPEVSIAREL